MPLLERTAPRRDLASSACVAICRFVLGVVHPRRRKPRVRSGDLLQRVERRLRLGEAVSRRQRDAARVLGHCPASMGGPRGSGMASSSSQRPNVTRVR